MREKSHGLAMVSRIGKSQVSFAKYRHFYRALLQKRPVIQLILQTECSPYAVDNGRTTRHLDIVIALLHMFDMTRPLKMH